MPWGSVINTRWADSRLEKASRTDTAGRKRWGEVRWKLMKRRIATLEAVDTLADMTGVAGHCHQLTGDRAGEFAIRLDGSLRLLFAPDHDPMPLLSDGGIDRKRVTAIVLTEVVDYHGH